jgi:SAM-dependent methyltransferase
MNDSIKLPKLYSDLADWWPVLSTPEDYAEEAAFYRQALLDTSAREIRTLLELGSGGGNNASHLKAHFELTLVDLSEGMLAVSKKLNPECEHHLGDMRTVRLGHEFDAVFIHDAIDYMTSEEDLRAAMQTAFKHCRPGGIALFAPDHTRESFKPSTDHGGHDRPPRSLRYLEWTWDPDPNDNTYFSLMVYALRTGQEPVEVVEDLHRCGLYGHQDWLRLLGEVGFQPQWIPFEHSEVEAAGPVFLGLKESGQ